MKDGNELFQSLRQYSGGDQCYFHPLVGRFFYTEGVKFFADNAGGGGRWLLDILATEPVIAKLVNEEGFGLVLLTVKGTKAGDSGIPPVFSRDLDYTDCPEAPGSEEGVWRLYMEPTVVGGKEGIMCMLPGER